VRVRSVREIRAAVRPRVADSCYRFSLLMRLKETPCAFGCIVMNNDLISALDARDDINRRSSRRAIVT